DHREPRVSERHALPDPDAPPVRSASRHGGETRLHRGAKIAVRAGAPARDHATHDRKILCASPAAASANASRYRASGKVSPNSGARSIAPVATSSTARSNAPYARARIVRSFATIV